VALAAATDNAIEVSFDFVGKDERIQYPLQNEIPHKRRLIDAMFF
jgi:hypothetical protein